jgi:hypothetical protein
LKTYNIEVQRLKAMSNQHGMIEAQVDASVLPGSPPRDGEPPATWLRMSEANARVLQSLLKAQLAEFDKRKARSQR